MKLKTPKSKASGPGACQNPSRYLHQPVKYCTPEHCTTGDSCCVWFCQGWKLLSAMPAKEQGLRTWRLPESLQVPVWQMVQFCACQSESGLSWVPGQAARTLQLYASKGMPRHPNEAASVTHHLCLESCCRHSRQDCTTCVTHILHAGVRDRFSLV